MIYIGAIIAILIVIYSLLKVDATVAFGPMMSAGIFKPKTFKSGMLAAVIITLLLMILGYVPYIQLDYGNNLSRQAILICAVSAFVTVLVTSQFTKFSSITYSFISALFGALLYISGSTCLPIAVKVFMSWMVAPVMGFMTAIVIYVIYNFIVVKINVHLLKLNIFVEYLMIIGSVILAFVFALNNGPILMMIANSSLSGSFSILVFVFAIIGLFLMLDKKMTARMYEMLDHEFDIQSPAAISILFSTAIVLLLFSSQSFTSSIGLCVSPIFLPSVMFMSLIGVGLVQNKEKIERTTVNRLLLSFIATPVIAFLLSYSICSLFNTSNLTKIAEHAVEESTAPDYNLFLFIVVLSVIALVLFFINYQQKAKAEERRKSLVQQQLIYENQKALNAIEVKGILAENISLHNRLEKKRQELIDVALNISEQKDFLASIYNKMRGLDTMKEGSDKDAAIRDVQQILFQRMSFRQEIDGFYTQAEILHKDFSIKLQEKFPNLTEQEKKLATLLRLGFSTKEIATLMNISTKSGEISRYRLRKKLNLSREDNLIKFIKTL